MCIRGRQPGRPDLQYVRLADAEVVGILVGAGFSEDAAHLHVELGRALNEGRVGAREARDEHDTAPTTFEEFAAALARSAAGQVAG